MKVLYYDCFCGISGDMNLGALADLGVDAGELNRQLSGLKLGGEFELRFQKGQKNGISGTRAEVILKDENLKSGGHHHRNFNDIRAILARSELDGEVKKRSLSLFRRVAAAEGKVHGKPPEEVHFHEVGAVDSIVDLVGAAVALNLLHADRILSSPVQLGAALLSARTAGFRFRRRPRRSCCAACRCERAWFHLKPPRRPAPRF